MKPSSPHFFRSLGHALYGIRKALVTERNLRIHILMAVGVIGLGVIFHISFTEWIAVIICMAMVISAELVNSALEKLVDMVTEEYSEKAGLVKDMAAGAVLIIALASAIIGLLIFIPRIAAW